MKFRTALLLMILTAYSVHSHAQLCQGSLGDPIVNITFGSGINPGPALSAAATGYQYMTVDCPNDGQYALRNRTDNCYGSWHSLSSDHTGNTNGYFMLVNASYQPSAFYLDTVDLFCSNTTYEFAAWAINMMRTTTCGGQATILPNLTFSIENTNGTVIQSYNTGDMPVTTSPTWNQYGFFFTAPSGVNRVVLRITNNAPGGCGNDLAIDDITFRPCGPLVNTTVQGNNGLLDLCQGQVAQYIFSANISTGFDNPLLQWQQRVNNGNWTDLPGANSNSLIVNIDPFMSTGIYQYRLAVSKPENAGIGVCRVNSGVTTIRINPNPVVNIQSNSPVCQNNSLNFSASGGDDYSWSGPNSLSGGGPFVTITSAQPNQSGRYYVTVSTALGCSKKDSIDVLVHPKPVAAITPSQVDICEGEQVNLSAQGGSHYNWQPSMGLSSSNISNPIARPSDTILYEVIVSNEFTCSDTATALVNVASRPVANAGPDREIFQGQVINLGGSAGGSYTDFSWAPDHAITATDILQPLVNPLADTSYILTVNSASCGSDSDTVQVKVYKGLFIPTAFTPNNDGLNDAWRIPGLGIYNEHELLVFNRYGQVIFSTKTNQAWDGRYRGLPQPTGAYPYLLRIKEGNIVLKGLVMIVR